MKKILLIAGLFLTNQAFCQTIPNSGFETWAAAGPFMAPTGWAVSPGVKQSNQAHSGSWALQCTVDTFTNPGTSTLDTIASTAFSGVQTMGPPTPGANLTGYAFTGRPDSLTGFYKYHAMGPDTMVVMVTLSHWNGTTNLREVVGQAMFRNSVNDSVYQRFSMPLQYTSTAATDTCVIQIMSANQQGPKHMGTSAWVDDLAFTNHVTAVADVAVAGAFTVYPNPFTDVINIAETNSIKITSVSLLNMTGQTVLSTTNKQLNTSNIAKGTYVLQTTDANGTVSSRLVTRQ